VSHLLASSRDSIPSPAAQTASALKRAAHVGGSEASCATNPYPAGAPAQESTALPIDREGLFAGRYRIESVLGTGGMGIVYAATHVELRLSVALKIIHPRLAHSPEVRARFTREARGGALLRSPHTLRIHDAGALGTGDCFVVMERLEGTNLDDLLRSKGPLPVEQAVDYVMQACAGLAEAHSIGLIHRDIKPENLFLAHFRCSAPMIKIMDFGIARWLSGEVQGARITTPQASLGSPCYQSPEQMENATDVDERTDIWSLGLTLFELLTGACPFEADTIDETCWRVLRGPRPSLLALRPDVEPGLARVIERCLEPDRTKRFGSVRQLAAALQPYKAKIEWPLAATRPLTARQTQASRRRRPLHSLQLASAFALGLSLMAGLQLWEPARTGLRSALRETSSAALIHASSVLQRLLPLANARPDSAN
jgi:serine/threonine protein kinase